MNFLKFCLLAIGLASSSAQAAPVKGRNFDRVIWVIFENTYYESAVKEPFFAKVAAQGALLTNLHAITHPSQGNYVALTSGSLNGVKGNGQYDLEVQNIVDLLEKRGVSWKVYAEDFPGNCFLGMFNGAYARKHNPFVSYVNIQRNSARCSRIVEAKEFARDAANGTLPQYSFYIPNQKNDGHDTGISFADKWYAKTFSRYFEDSAFLRDTLIVTTFDESGGTHQNHIYTSLVGGMVPPKKQIDQRLSLYSLLRMVQDNWSLGTFGKEDEGAELMPDFWK